MKKKNIVILGADGKVGSFISNHLKQLNHSVINSDLTNNSKKIEFICDLTKEFKVKNLIKKIEKKYKYVDCVINLTHYKGSGSKLQPNNNFFKAFENYDFDEWKKTLDVNLNGLFLASREFTKLFIKQKKGNFIFVSSTYGLVSPNKTIYGNSGINSPIGYAVTKSAITNFTRYLATHLGQYGIIANCLVPGGIEDKNQSNNFKKNYKKLTPLQRLSKLDDYKNVLSYLIDPGDYTTGSIVVVDGGWTAW